MKMTIAELRNDIQFFLEHAGWASPPGRMACAYKLARAEADAQLLGWSWSWEIDEEGCIGCDCGDSRCKCATGADHETLCCILRDNKGTVLATLGGICEPDVNYRRVIEAELACEAL